MNDKRWDVFISHASEDKKTVVRPLAAALKRAGARVWLDEHELKIGDSLSEKIDYGLASSRFGVVVLSPSFLAKQWPKKELAGLRAIEEDGQKVILPVWHNVDKTTIAKSSPVLADLVAISTSEGLDKVAAAILANIFSPNSGSPSQYRPKVSRRLIELLDSEPNKSDVLSFLQSHPKMVGHLLNSRLDPIWSVHISGVVFDALALGNLGTTRVPTLKCVLFLPIWQSPFLEINTSEGREVFALKPSLMAAIENAHQLVSEYEGSATESEFAEINYQLSRVAEEKNIPAWNLGISPLIEITIFAGRRKYVDATQGTARTWRDYRASNPSCQLRTYDGLIEAFQAMEAWQEKFDSGLGPWNFTDYSDPYYPA